MLQAINLQVYMRFLQVYMRIFMSLYEKWIPTPDQSDHSICYNYDLMYTIIAH